MRACFIQEFVQSEIDREAAAVADDRERSRKAEDRTAGVDDKLKRLREQVSTLQEGVSQVIWNEEPGGGGLPLRLTRKGVQWCLL